MPKRRSPVRLYKKISRGRESPYWWVDYTTPAGERVRRTTRCTEYGAALRLGTEWYRDAQQRHADQAAGIVRPSEVTLLALADDFLSRMKAERSAAYASSLADNLRAYVLPYFGNDAAAAGINRQAVEGFRRAVASGAVATRAKNRRRTTPSTATVNRVMSCLRRLLDHGLREGLLTTNPAANLKALRERPEERHRALTKEELRRWLDELERCRRGPEHVLWLRFGVATGLRSGEISLLRWSDIDFVRRHIHVRAGTSKSARRRLVPLTAAAAMVLDELMPDDVQPVGLVFGRRSRRTALERAWTRTGLPGRPPSAHDLRHTFSSRAMDAGLTALELQAFMGHTSLATTSRYVHLYGDVLQTAAAKLDEGLER